MTPFVNYQALLENEVIKMIKVDNVRNLRSLNNVVYIGRKCGKFEGSILGNPFKIGRDGNREEVVEKYRQWLWRESNKNNRDNPIWKELEALVKKHRLWGDITLVCWCAPQECHGDVLKRCLEWMEKEGYYTKILQCHSRGDKRFTPFNCYVKVFGITKSIENHYQTAKRFKDQPSPKDWREAKTLQKAGNRRIGFEVNGIWLPPETNKIDDLAIQFYIAVWYKYLKLHPELIAIAQEYDEFVDIFKGKFPFCQADVIRQVVNHGLESLLPMCKDFFTLCRK